MKWFRDKRTPVLINPEQDAQLTNSKNRVKEAASDAVAAASRLNNLIDNNGFTVIIAASMGAQQQKER